MGNHVGDRALLVMAWAKAIIGVLLAGVVVYSIVAGIPVNAELLKVILGVLAAYFGLSARMYYSARDGGDGGRWRG